MQKSANRVIPCTRYFSTYHEYVALWIVDFKWFLIVQAQYSLSKFRLKVNIEHVIDRESRVVRFALDAAKPNLVLRTADGFWYVESLPNQPQRTRVWLSANILASSLIPSVIVDYAAYKALPRATTWLQPYFAGQPVPKEGLC